MADWELAVAGEPSIRKPLIHSEAMMYWDVKRVCPLDNYEIYVELEDGRKGIFDLKPYLDHGVFKELKNKAYFSQVEVVFGAVAWPHEQDTVPETLLAGLKPVEEEINAK